MRSSLVWGLNKDVCLGVLGWTPVWRVGRIFLCRGRGVEGWRVDVVLHDREGPLVHKLGQLPLHHPVRLAPRAP